MIRGWPWLFLLLLLLLPLLGACGTQRFAAQGWSGLVLGEETLYAGTREGRIIALNPENGASLWTYPDPDSQEKNLGGIYSPPVLDGNMLYVATYESRKDQCQADGEGKVPCGRLYAIEIQRDGTTLRALPAWRFPHADLPGVGTMVGAPVVAGNIVLIGSSDGRVYALVAEKLGQRWTVDQKWVFETEGKVWSTPAVQDNLVYISSLGHTLYAVDLESGSEVWHFETNGAITGTPLVENGKVYIGSFDRRLYALDAATGMMLWEFKGDQWFWAGPVSDGTAIYAATLGGTLYALDPDTGRELWLNPVETTGSIIVPPLVLPQYVAIASNAGVLSVRYKSDGEEWWHGADLGAPVRSPLVTQGDFVYISDLKDNVLAVNVKLKDLPSEGRNTPGVWRHLVKD